MSVGEVTFTSVNLPKKKKKLDGVGFNTFTRVGIL